MIMNIEMLIIDNIHYCEELQIPDRNKFCSLIFSN